MTYLPLPFPRLLGLAHCPPPPPTSPTVVSEREWNWMPPFRSLSEGRQGGSWSATAQCVGGTGQQGVRCLPSSPWKTTCQWERAKWFQVRGASHVHGNYTAT